MTDLFVTLATVIVLVVVAAAVIRLLVDVVTIRDYERGLRYTRGRFAGLLDAGTYTAFRPMSQIHVLDGRPVSLVIEGQEVLTGDGIGVKISLAARYVVADVVTAVTGDQDFRRALYITLQLALRDAVGGRTLDEVLATRAEIGRATLERAGSLVAALGVELLAVEVRDLMLPGELRRAYAAVVAARKEGEVALERARGETAALRNLANAAGMLEQHPGLLQIRLLQEVGGSSGNTIMMGMPDGATPAGTGVTGSRRRPTDRPDVAQVPPEDDAGR
jgi:regulator of protease activity HflC (stomatin/prohibitin superfamily)